MQNTPKLPSYLLILCLSITLSACFARRRLITRQGKQDTRALITASKEVLLDRIALFYNAIHSFRATINMTPSVGSVYKGEITEYIDVRGFILFRKPDQIRIIGQDPVIHTTAFDMVSSGPEFRVHLPSKKLFIIGQNDAPTTSKNKLENLRPAAFLGSMLVKPPDPATELSLLEDDTDEDHAFYVILILHKQQDHVVLERSVYFDRLTLRMIRQKSFDETGATTSDTRYSEWKSFNNVIFPTVIDINRPKDEYGVVMKVVKLDINVPITDDKFVLTQPEGTKLQVIGTKP